MDGNGRWAQSRGLSRRDGHQAGFDNAIRIAKLVSRLEIPYLTLFAFSIENWSRPPEEVAAIFRFMHSAQARRELEGSGIRIGWLGSRTRLTTDQVDTMQEFVRDTSVNTGMTLSVAFNYSGRDDILQGVRKLLDGEVRGDDLNAELLERQLMTSGIPDPDLVIRTGREQRISNFLLWQAAYSELYFSRQLWPDFGRRHLMTALRSYARRKRRFGRVD